MSVKKFKTKNLAIVGKIVIFKTIVMSKIVFQSFITRALKYIAKTQKAFFRNVLHETLCNNDLNWKKDLAMMAEILS